MYHYVFFLELSFGSPLYTNGCVEGTTVVCRGGEVIGPISFHWKPLTETSFQDSRRCLWIWCHPAIHETLFQELCSIFRATQQKIVDDSVLQTGGCFDKYPDIPITVFASDTVRITQLKERLCRFKLRGASSSSILGDLLLPADVQGKTQNRSCTPCVIEI